MKTRLLGYAGAFMLLAHQPGPPGPVAHFLPPTGRGVTGAVPRGFDRPNKPTNPLWRGRPRTRCEANNGPTK